MGLIRGPADNLVGDHCLIGIHGHMLHRDLLLVAVGMVPDKEGNWPMPPEVKITVDLEEAFEKLPPEDTTPMHASAIGAQARTVPAWAAVPIFAVALIRSGP